MAGHSFAADVVSSRGSSLHCPPSRPSVSCRRQAAWSKRQVTSAIADREVSRRPDLRGALPPAPPPFSPPPPPPPPLPVDEAGPSGPRRAVILGILLGGAGLWWRYLDSQMPPVYRDKNGVHYMVTQGGNQVAVSVDRQGRTYFINKAGDLFYDTGDRRIGFYVVDAKDQIFNVYINSEGQPQRVKVGSLGDLGTVHVSEYGGIPVANLQRAAGERRRRPGTITAFPDPDAGTVMLPPNTPFTRDKDGNAVPPPYLEEGGIILKEKGGWWPFGKSDDGGGPLERGVE